MTKLFCWPPGQRAVQRMKAERTGAPPERFKRFAFATVPWEPQR